VSDVERWRELAQQFRVDSIRTAAAAKSGHPTSGMSAADLMAVLVAKYFRYDFDDPRDLRNDRLVFSKGHASTLMYAIFRAVGAITDEELLTYRQHGSRLEGHPTPVLPWVDVATGSLGQGLPIGVGMALGAKHLEGSPTRVWVLHGDSEMAEGSVWEAYEHAAHYELDNLTAVLDVNRLGQRGETMVGWDVDRYRARAEAFGWHAIVIDGHDLEAIDRAYAEAIETRGRPTVVIARTIKGKGVSAVADKGGFHGKALDDPEAAIAELGGVRDIRVEVRRPRSSDAPHRFPAGGLELPSWQAGEKVATRKAYGEALAALGGARGEVVALDGEVDNSTYASLFDEAHPERYFEMFIAEQQMVAAAVGLQVRGWLPFASTFAAFVTRAFDFVRMAAVSQARLCLSGSHVGVSIGEDGPSQMGLEDLAMMRAVYGSVVLQPCDANQTAHLVAAMGDHSGIAYIRTMRESTPVLYDPGERFEIGGSRVLRSSDDDGLTIVGTGVTVHEALGAAQVLADDGITARVIDAYSIKPIDAQTLRTAARETGGPIITVEDHWADGGLGDAVAAAVSELDRPPRVVKLAVRDMPGSGTPAELRAWAGIDAASIADSARRLAKEA
jgi:transketolase